MIRVLLLFYMATSPIAYGQELPNYSGKWNLNLEDSQLEAAWTEGITAGTFQIEHKDPHFALWRVFTIKGRNKKQDYQILTHGEEQKGKFRTTWSMVWQEDRLYLTVTRKGMVNTVEYYLTEQGQLVADERQTSANVNYHNHWVFDRVGE